MFSSIPCLYPGDEVACSPPGCNKRKHLQTLANVPWRATSSPIERPWYIQPVALVHKLSHAKYTWEALKMLMTPPEILVLCSQGFVLGISWFISSPSSSNVQSRLRTTGQKYLVINCEVVKQT